ncbi:MAG TPA: hypothetical protein V6D14_03980 [Coleofasciculaceae cyanobacterium]|jgi:hypothetical protein
MLKSILKTFFIITTLFLVSSTALAVAPLPTPNGNGDYSGNVGYEKWIVVDPDPNGLNCRWSEQAPKEWYAPDANIPNWNIGQWPVVRRFKKDTSSQYLTANLTPGGFATVTDELGKPWLKVSIGSDEEICLVRANADYVQPVN